MHESYIYWIPDAYWLRHHQHALGVTAGVILALKQLPYIFSIFKGRTKPNRASWAIWSVLGMIAFAAYVQTGETDNLWVPLVLAIAPLTVTLIAFRKGNSDDGKYDRMAIALAGMSLVVWVVSGSAALGLAAVILADTIGTLPTLRKALLWPSSEYLPSWAFSLFAYSLNLLAIQQWSLFHAAYPVYLVLWSVSIIGAILIGRTRERLSANGETRLD